MGNLLLYRGQIVSVYFGHLRETNLKDILWCTGRLSCSLLDQEQTPKPKFFSDGVGLERLFVKTHQRSQRVTLTVIFWQTSRHAHIDCMWAHTINKTRFCLIQTDCLWAYTNKEPFLSYSGGSPVYTYRLSVRNKLSLITQIVRLNQIEA